MTSLVSIKARQMKAARALLDWSQEDLAKATGLSVATIRKLELGYISPRGKTISQIRNAFEGAGLEFLEPDGVRHRPEEITVYQGHEGICAFFDDVYETMVKKGGDIVTVCVDEDPFSKTLGDYRFVHFDRMIAIKDKVFVKCILTDNPRSRPAQYCEYRWISKGYVDSVPFYIYDDKFAIIVFDSEPSPKITVIQSPSVAKAFRRQFYSMWDKATPLGPLKGEAPAVPDKRMARRA